MTLPVSVVLNGRLVTGSRDAEIRHGVIVAPLDPYVRTFATTIATESRGRITLERGGRTFVLSIGSRDAVSGSIGVKLPIAPYVRADEPIIPLAAAARALGASVDYNAATRTVDIETPSLPLSTPTPYAAWSPPPGELPTFEPYEAPTPQPTVSGIPHPRRTPLLVTPSGAGSGTKASGT